MIKNIFLLVALSGMLSGCGQTTSKTDQDKSDIIMPTNPDLTPQNFIDVLAKTVKHYPEEPYYFLEIENIKGCTYEILVNDVPVFKYYGDSQVSAQVDIQYYILKSGPQKITYRLHPIGKRADGSEISTLADWTEFNVTLLKIDKSVKDPYLAKKVIQEYHSPKKPDGKSFIGSGLQLYENSFTFNAVVPYENTGWTNSTDLTRMDKSALLKQTAAAYQKIFDFLANRNQEAYFKLLYTKEKENSQSEYSTKDELQTTLSAYLLPFENQGYKLEPLDQYQLVIYGDGRLACLESTSSDQRLKGKSPLWGKYKDDDGNVLGLYRKLYLHIPKGKTAFEIIR